MNIGHLLRHKQSIESAKILQQMSLDSNSIHCSYYAVYQLMLHIGECRKMNLRAGVGVGERGGSHQRTISIIHEKLKQADSKAASTWHSEITELRKHRIAADYETKNQCGLGTECIKISKRLSETLIKYLSN